MTDEKIIDLYWERSEDAIEETSKKYGNYCHSIAYNILKCSEDASECVNDTYLNAWRSMPSLRPSKLSAFLGKVTRNLALTRYDYYNAEKRGNSRMEVALDELAYCVSDDEAPEDTAVDKMVIADILNRFLKDLSEKNRNIFVCRYFYLNSIGEIAKKYRLSENAVKVSLHRSRILLKTILEKEGMY